jgi:hypothetical protein
LPVRHCPNSEVRCIVHTAGIYNDITVLALKFVYYLDDKKVAISCMPDDTSILSYEKAEGNYCRLAG